MNMFYIQINGLTLIPSDPDTANAINKVEKVTVFQQ